MCATVNMMTELLLPASCQEMLQRFARTGLLDILE
jgi:hypothetical protein